MACLECLPWEEVAFVRDVVCHIAFLCVWPSVKNRFPFSILIKNHDWTGLGGLGRGGFISYAAQYDKPATPIHLVPEKYSEVVAAFAQLTPAQQTRAATLRNFLSGFETPFSLELLATVDWIICQKPDLTPMAIHAEINTWTKRKAELIKPYHVQVAYEHLKQYKHLLCEALWVSQRFMKCPAIVSSLNLTARALSAPAALGAFGIGFCRSILRGDGWRRRGACFLIPFFLGTIAPKKAKIVKKFKF